MEQSKINNVQPEQHLSSDNQLIDTTSSPTNAKPIVGCSDTNDKFPRVIKQSKDSITILVFEGKTDLTGEQFAQYFRQNKSSQLFTV